MKKIVINCIIIFSIIITAIFLTTLNSYAIDRDPNSSKGFAEFDDEAAAQETQELIQEQQEEQSKQQKQQNKTYTIKAGDTLSKIAREQYGDANQWDKIYQANKDILQSPHKIQIGQELKIP